MITEKLNMEEVEEMIDPNMIVKCCLCGEEVPFRKSNNPWPLADDDGSRCCRMCNANKVLPARLHLLMMAEQTGG